MVGRTIHQYELLEKLGSGGMGDIYKAQDKKLGRFVAIKALTLESGSDPDRRRRFVQEAQAASALNHPNIITIHDILQDQGADFMVMEYVAGKTLVDLIPNGGLRTPQVLKYSVQMADALNAAHQAGIIHRDLKPGNVMVTDSGLVKILDFGLAKLADRGPISHINSGDDKTRTIAAAPLTVEGSIIGTVSYMSPEQAQGHKVDTRSDIFSFGVVLYEMSTGVRAFTGDSPLSTLSAILRDTVPPIQIAAPEHPEQLTMVIDRCLRKNPDERWQTMKDVQMALSALNHQSDSGMLYRSRLTEIPSNIQAPTGQTRIIAGQESTTILPLGATQQNPALTSQTLQAAVASPEPPKKGSKSGLIAVVAGIVLMLIAGVGGWMMLNQRKAAEIGKQEAAAAAIPAPVVVEQPPPVPADTGLTNDMIIDMVRNKLSTGLILSQIRAEKNSFILTAPELIRLHNAGVSDAIIEGMRSPSKIPEQPKAPVQTAATNPPPKQNPTTPPPSTPQPVSAAPAPAPATPPTPPPVAAPEPVKAAAPVMQTITDATPFSITLAQDISNAVEEGAPVQFIVTEDLKIGDSIVVAKNTPVTGAIVKKKGTFNKSPTMRIDSTTTTGGQKLNLRATQQKGKTVSADAGKSKNKDFAAMAGSGYVAYVDGTQTVPVKH